MRFIPFAVIFGSLLLVMSCHQNKEANIEQLAKKVEASEPPSPPSAAELMNGENEYKETPDDFFAGDKNKQEAPDRKKFQQKQPPQKDPAAKPDWDKKIIKTGSINLEVKDYNNYYTSLREKVKSLGGYIAQEEQSQSDYKIENSMTIKVPVDQFDNAMVQLTAQVEKINQRKVNSQDVTAEVVDIKSRMEAKKQVRQRYMDLLGQARNMTDILTVQDEINGIQEEIESAAGRVEYLSHASAFSSIDLTYYQVLNASAKDPNEVKEPSFGVKVKSAFAAGWDIVSSFFLVIITIWPLLLATFFVIFLYKRYFKSKRPEAG